MKHYEEITLKNGKTCILRHGEAADGEAVLSNLLLTHEQTDNLLTYPDKYTMTAQKEAEYLQKEAGFVTYGVNPKGFRSRGGHRQALRLMVPAL